MNDTSNVRKGFLPTIEFGEITGLPWEAEANNETTITGLSGFDIRRVGKSHIVAQTYWHKTDDGYVSGEANAKFIVHCVNTYSDREALIGELVEACKKASRFIDEAITPVIDEDFLAGQNLCDLLDQVISKVIKGRAG